MNGKARGSLQPTGVRRAATVKDVAREAGVSIASVSRVINGNDCVADFTRTRILEAIDRLEYVPHYGAHSLVTRRNNLVGVLLPALHAEFFAQLVCGIEDEARRHGMHILVSNSCGDEAEDARILAALRGRVGGLLLMATHERAAFLTDRLPADMPAVLLNTHSPDSRHSTLSIDNCGAAAAVMRHLAGCGRHRVAHIAGPRNNSDAAARLRGYRDGVRAHWPGTAPLVIEGDFSQESGVRAARRIAALAERPDAVFAANDLMAIGAARAFREAGISIPEAVALVGFDDIPLASLVTPPLTTMRIDVGQFGRRALERLVHSMQEPDGVHGEMDPIRPTLVVRQSCGHGPTPALASA